MLETLIGSFVIMVFGFWLAGYILDRNKDGNKSLLLIRSILLLVGLTLTFIGITATLQSIRELFF